jgi:hypothetical protein
MYIPQRWEVEDDSSSGVDKDMLQSWNDNSGGGDGLSKGTSEIREMESEHAINIRDLEDKVLEEEFGSIVNEHANTVRRSGRVRTQVDIYSPEDPHSDQRDYDWESHYSQQQDDAIFYALVAARKMSISHKSTLVGEDKDKWEVARAKEMAVHSNGTWTEVHEIPRGCVVLPLKWVYAIKRDGKYKARIVCCGNFDPFDGPTYAPTAIKSVMWLVLALVVMFDMEVRIFDISAAFVAEPITREVFVWIERRSEGVQ